MLNSWLSYDSGSSSFKYEGVDIFVLQENIGNRIKIGFFGSLIVHVYTGTFWFVLPRDFTLFMLLGRTLKWLLVCILLLTNTETFLCWFTDNSNCLV